MKKNPKVFKRKLSIHNQKVQLVLFMVGFGIIGGLAIVFSHAATSSSSIEPENGTTSGAVSRVTDASASGGQAVKFGSSPGSGSGNDTTCVFKKADLPLSVAFCDGFDNGPEGANTQTGDLSPLLWGVSRVGNINVFSDQMANSFVSSHNACSGGGVTGNPVTGDPNSVPFGTATPPPSDVQICHGQMAEALNDGHAVVNLDTYPKQPFDFTGRTGTVVFDVSMNSDGTHGAWPEFIITDEPVPGARYSISGQVPPHAVNEVGITLDGCGGACVGRVYVSKNGNYSVVNGSSDIANGVDAVDPSALLTHDAQVQETPKTSVPGMALNHVEVRISQNTLEVWASDPGGANFKEIAHVANLGLTFTKGLVWMTDTHYNARKAIEIACDGGFCSQGTQYDHTFLWDNLGFDGPKTYRDLGFDVPYSNIPGAGPENDPALQTGYRIGSGDSQNFTVKNVAWTPWGTGNQNPTKAKVVLDVATDFDTDTVSVSLNSHAAVTKTVDSTAISFDFPTSDAVQGTNTITIKSVSGLVMVANISLIMVAGAQVP